MNYYLVAPTLRAHSDGYFTYQDSNDLTIGCIVLIEIGKRSSVAVVIKKVAKPAFATKPIIKTIEAQPLPQPLLRLADWLREYYQSPTSSVWQTLLPSGLDKKRQDKPTQLTPVIRSTADFSLNREQQAAVRAIIKSSTATNLLEGVTGSGKTAVYIESAKHVINNEQRSVVILVPEIALTAQLVSEFSQNFNDIVLVHSGMSPAKRHIIWQKVLHAKTPMVVIGPRSALFMPLRSVGLIVIDECHESSFKQEQQPRYSALRAAKILANYHEARLVLGSATPNVADRFLAEQTKANLILLTTPAKKIGKIDIQLIDSKLRLHFSRHSFLSTPLLQAIEKALSAKQQVLLFHNRRGSHPITLCEHCGWSALCDHCFLPLVLHSDKHTLQCHVCGKTQAIPMSCPSCHKPHVIHKGIGTKRIEEAISRLFPSARVARFDGDSLAHERLDKVYADVYSGAVDIIIGTQIVAKGLDLPKLSTVGVVQADNGLRLPDFSAQERVFQLLYQVMGRVGRDDKLSKIIIQTYQPDNEAIVSAIKRDYSAFYQYALEKRRREIFPPYCYLLKLACAYKTEASAHQAALKLIKILQKKAPPQTELLGPSPAFYERVAGTYRWQILVKSPKRSDLVSLLTHLPAAKWQAELDPVSLL